MKRLLIPFTITSLIFGFANIVSKEFRDMADKGISQIINHSIIFMHSGIFYYKSVL